MQRWKAERIWITSKLYFSIKIYLLNYSFKIFLINTIRADILVRREKGAGVGVLMEVWGV